jgi:hypothetical protein
MLLLRAGPVCSGVFFGRHASQGEQTRIMALVWVLNLAIFTCEVYGLYFEPFNSSVSRVGVSLPDMPVSTRSNVVQLADWHIERITRRERAVLKEVERLDPDLILLTGDYLNLSYIDDARARGKCCANWTRRMAFTLSPARRWWIPALRWRRFLTTWKTSRCCATRSSLWKWMGARFIWSASPTWG